MPETQCWWELWGPHTNAYCVTHAGCCITHPSDSHICSGVVGKVSHSHQSEWKELCLAPSVSLLSNGNGTWKPKVYERPSLALWDRSSEARFFPNHWKSRKAGHGGAHLSYAHLSSPPPSPSSLSLSSSSSHAHVSLSHTHKEKKPCWSWALCSIPITPGLAITSRSILATEWDVSKAWKKNVEVWKSLM